MRGAGWRSAYACMARAIGRAQRVGRERGVRGVPVVWRAGDHHAYARAKRASVLGSDGDPGKKVVRERAVGAMRRRLCREGLRSDIRSALAPLPAALTD